MNIKKRMTLTALAAALLVTAGAPTASAQIASCIDNAVINCFDGCNNPLNFQDCIIGCAIGSNNDPRNCHEKCPETPVCEANCNKTSQQVANCAYVTGTLTSVCGALALNRATGVYQQVVKITNTSSTLTLDKISFVVDSLAPGWSLTNGTGMTAFLVPIGSPYKDLGTLAPGETKNLVLEFKRTGSAGFGYITRVVQGYSVR